MTTHIFENATTYRKNNALQYNFAMKFLSNLTLFSNARVLDIGCGDGLITSEIAKIVTEGCVIGTDISKEMISFASKEHILQENLRFLQMNSTKNIFREQFDIVTSFNCLHWVKQQKQALQGIMNSGVKGALIAILLSHKKSTYHFVLDSLCKKNKWEKYFLNYINPRSFFAYEYYKELLIEIGLNEIQISEEEMAYQYKSKEQLKRFFLSAGYQIKQIPPVYKEEFLEDFVVEYLKQTQIKADEPIPVNFWCLQIIAKK